jgi:fucose 4-O-acetylase-like acetyltransferase
VPHRRLTFVDASRGVAIILVVYAHSVKGLHSAGLADGQAIALGIDQLCSAFRMPLLFFLSGSFFMPRPFTSIGDGVKARAQDLLLPFFIWTSIQGGCEWLVSAHTNTKANLEQILTGFIVPRGQFWFLPSLFFCGILVVIASRFKNWRYWVIWAALGSGFATVHTQFLLYLPFFCLGAVFGRDGLQRPSRPYIGITALLGLFTIIPLWMAQELPGPHPTAYKIYALALPTGMLSIMVCLFTCSLLPPRLQRLLAWFGKRSLPIFLAHILATAGSRIILNQGLGITHFGLHLAAGTLLGVLLPCLAYNWTQKRGYSLVWGQRLKARENSDSDLKQPGSVFAPILLATTKSAFRI